MATIPVATAMAYLAAGLSCLPAAKAKKRPSIGGWKTWQSRLPTKVEVKAWFSNPHDAICVVSGNVSGNLECMDFDQHGELFAAWMDKIDTELLAKLVIEQTPSGGYHVFYRVDGGTGNGEQGTGVIDGNLKLARGIREGKEKTLIETRGEGGLFLCAPTEGYSLQQGDFANLAVIPPDARKALLDAARSLDELPAASCPSAPAGADTGQRGADFAPTGGKDAWELPPGDDFNARGDIHGLLTDAGWQFCGTKPDGNEQWTRPGKDPRNGVSATYKDGSFYVFSSNAAPFEPNVKYSPFAVYATLRHNGDFTAAASALHTAGYGKAKEPTLGVTFNLKPTASAAVTGQPDDGPVSIADLYDLEMPLKPVVIDGILRKSEIMNLIAAPKTGKSWLTLHLALCIASGREWLGHTCTPHKVLYIDNELHRETSMNRLKLVLKASGIPYGEVKDNFDFWHLRGKWKSVEEIGNRIEAFKAKDYGVIIVDAFYRALPRGTVENDNGAITDVYNMLDRFAQEIGCSFILIHHTSKGNQSQKSVTDVGAGAGAQSRAADTHGIIREHKVDGYLVLELVVRSFPKHPPIVLKKEFPLMVPDYDMDPTDLAGKAEVKPRQMSAEESVNEVERISGQLPGIVDRDNPPTTKAFVLEIIKTYGCSRTAAREALNLAVENGILCAGRMEDAPVAFRNAKFIVPPEMANRLKNDG